MGSMWLSSRRIQLRSFVVLQLYNLVPRICLKICGAKFITLDDGVRWRRVSEEGGLVLVELC
jgi:hypothetical protein